MQKPCYEGSPYIQEFREAANTPSLAADVKSKQNDDVANDQISLENLRSFYRELCEEEMAKINQNASFQSTSPGFISPALHATPFSTSKSASPSAPAADVASSSSGSTVPTGAEIGSSERDVVVIMTYSRSPCEDFRRSMEEIVAARVESRGGVDREFMEELLFRYLELNNDKFFRDILRAFLELIGISYDDSGRMVPPPRGRWSGGFSKKRLKLEIRNIQKLCCKYRC